MSRLLFACLCVVLLSSCGKPPKPFNPIVESRWAYEPNRRDELLAQDNFSIDLVRFEDVRNPRSLVDDPNDDIIYEYNPDQLVNGVKYRFPVVLQKHMMFGERKEKRYMVEFELEVLKTVIKTGKLYSGPYGSFLIEIKGNAIARRPDSTVIMNEPVQVILDKRRESHNGRNPSAELDRKRMYELFDEATRHLARDIAWRVRWVHNYSD